MITIHNSRKLTARMFAAITFLSCFAGGLHGQDDPQLVALSAKLEAAKSPIHKVRDAALAVARKAYLVALNGAEAKVTAAGNTVVLKAVMEEKQAVTEEREIKPQPDKSLPRDLTTARNTYLREATRISQTTAAQITLVLNAHLRDLGALEIKARSAKNAVLLEQVANEKLKLLGQAQASANGASKPTGKNMVVNGNFSQVVDGKLVGWTERDGQESLLKENGNHFIRLVAKDIGYHKGALQKIVIPAGVKSVTLRCRVRGDWTPQVGGNGSPVRDSWFGMGGWMRNEEDKTLGPDGTPQTTYVLALRVLKSLPKWKNEEVTANVPSTAKFFEIYPVLRYGAGTMDVDDLEVEFK